MERPRPAGLVDVALACGMWELRPPVVRGWSEGTTMLHEAIEEGDGENQVKAAFLNSLDSRREDWAQRMLRSAHILKGARKVRLAHLRGDSRLIRHFSPSANQNLGRGAST